MKKIIIPVIFVASLLVGCANIDHILYETDTDELVSSDELPTFQKDWYKTSAGDKDAEAGNYYEIIDGVLYGYGENNWGQLGLGRIDDVGIRYSQGVRIADDIVHVSMSGLFVIYLDQDGDLYGMGLNNSGQLGQKIESVVHDNSSTSGISKPVLIMSDVEYAEAVLLYTVILKRDGTLWTFGSNCNGQLGDDKQGTSTETFADSPALFSYTPICIIDHVIYVTTTSYTSAAIREDRSLWMWGDIHTQLLLKKTVVTKLHLVTTVFFHFLNFYFGKHICIWYLKKFSITIIGFVIVIDISI